MATSRFENLRAALASAITTQLSDDAVTGVTVYKYPSGATAREDMVVIGNISGNQEPYTEGANGFRMEEMEVELSVRCPTFGDTVDEFATVEQRAEQVMASIETKVRTDPTVGSTIFNIEFAAYETNHTTDGQGAVGVIDITLLAEAHI